MLVDGAEGVFLQSFPNLVIKDLERKLFYCLKYRHIRIFIDRLWALVYQNFLL